MNSQHLHHKRKTPINYINFIILSLQTVTTVEYGCSIAIKPHHKNLIRTHTTLMSNYGQHHEYFKYKWMKQQHFLHTCVMNQGLKYQLCL
jgi:hypothetical protein